MATQGYTPQWRNPPKEELEEKTPSPPKPEKEDKKTWEEIFDKEIPTYLDRIANNHGKELIFFLGVTGSGKSTTINVLLGNKLIKANIVDEPTDDDDSFISESDEEDTEEGIVKVKINN